jgi:cupin fold WbuC family metalloprotein
MPRTGFVFDRPLLDSLSEQARRSPRARQHFNLHANYEEPCQRLLNAIEPGSYIPPHRHAIDPKTESLIAVRGLFALILFDDTGAVADVVRFGSERYLESSAASIGVELQPGTWHTVLALVPGSVLLEIKAGPFIPTAAKELAPWAPGEGSADVPTYLRFIEEAVRRSGE